ncbi:2-oxoglutarate-dependent dioxygenase [Vigna angularis]|uniref:2-oxoglutarate-dependent dioxygenase n=1 Tax=Phaseolus angularis TaxID=3914 RepID=A0A8T0KYZ1_PHAAN|nr:2-oxoglutarate-dependent dioxygenase [Vigna angularis]
MSLNVDVEELVTEMEEVPTFAPSIPVPNVQEIVRNNPLQVPQRYVRSNEELEKVNHMPHLSSEVPVIDLALLSCGNKDELLKLDVACKEWGFFQSHVPPDTGNFDFGQKLQRDSCRDVIEAYTSEVRRVSKEIQSSLSEIMETQKHVFLGLHKESLEGFRVNYYPPCNTPEQVLGLSPHSDTSTITLLMQDDDINGLEIRHKGGWVPVTPISDALVVNVGDVIQILTNGRYKSVEHRAVTNKNKKRISYALFVCPEDDAEVEPLDHMIDAQNPKLYQKVRYGDYLRQSMKRKMEGKTHIDVAMLEHSDTRNGNN